ncbi:MAG: hypothetical protein IPO09_09125 [Anaeromyxobacter sp.]|nr:hypothetical protein [Anaeromyxobacter sp.]MBL0277606.1 hypothetical protein [Anaeromyxobacter sp.]
MPFPAASAAPLPPGQPPRTFRRALGPRVQLVLLHTPVAAGLAVVGPALPPESWGAGTSLGFVMALSVTLAAAAAWWLIWIVRRFRAELARVVVIDQAGVELRTRRGASRIDWGEVQEVWFSAKKTSLHLHGGGLAGLAIGLAVGGLTEAAPPELKLRVVGRGGQLELDDDDLGTVAALEALVERTSARLTAEFVRRVRAGESLRFGSSVVLSSAGLVFPSVGVRAALTEADGAVPWPRVQRLRLQAGELVATIAGERRERSRAAKDVPNVFVLPEVVRVLSGRPNEEEGPGGAEPAATHP